MNIYAYVGGDPMNSTDPGGLEACGTNCGSSLVGWSIIGDWNGNGRWDVSDDALGADIGRWAYGAASLAAGINPITGEKLHKSIIAEYTCDDVYAALDRKSASSILISVRVSPTIRNSSGGLNTPSWFTLPTYSDPYTFIAGRTGLHRVNYRVPGTGNHLSSGHGGLSIHDDFHDPTTSLGEAFNHFRFEVVPLLTGGIKRGTYYDYDRNNECLSKREK